MTDRSDPVKRERRDGVAELRLDRPPVNALDPTLVDALRDGLAEAFAGDAGAVVLRGRTGVFSAGLDLPALLALDDGDLRGFWQGLFGLLEDLARAPVPVVAALTGHSAAGGSIIALFCDYRVMARGDFRIGLNEVQAGLVVPAAIRAALARLTGPYRAERHLLAGALVDPAEAQAMGLVDELAEPEAVVDRAHAWCSAHLALPAHAFVENRRLLRADLAGLFDTGGGLDVDAFMAHWRRDDTQQALQRLVSGFRRT